jgi:hypothetical protein
VSLYRFGLNRTRIEGLGVTGRERHGVVKFPRLNARELIIGSESADFWCWPQGMTNIDPSGEKSGLRKKLPEFYPQKITCRVYFRREKVYSSVEFRLQGQPPSGPASAYIGPPAKILCLVSRIFY